MSAIENGTTGLPDPAPVITKEWSPGVGEAETHEWPLGTPANILAEYETAKAAAEAGNNTQSLVYRNANGRASLVARFARTGTADPDYGDDVSVIEELYSVDVIKDVAEAGYWDDLTDDEVAWVRYCADNRMTQDEIDTAADASEDIGTALKYVSWSYLMKQLYGHIVHGVETFFETGFILRRSLYGVRTAAIKASFTGINEVGNDPVFKSQMDALIAALPAGEWLYKPPQAEHLGKGRWRVTVEWHWAKRWSVMYEGTWTGTSETS